MNPNPSNPLEIDRNALDREWQRQPGRARQAGVREADAKLAHNRASSALKTTRARLYLAVRSAPGAHGLRDKPTIDEIDAAVEVHPEHVLAVELVHTTAYAVDVAKAETTAYVDRRKALENLVELLQMDYVTTQEPRTREGSKPAPRDMPGIDFPAREDS